MIAILAAGGAWQQRNHAIAEAQRAEKQTELAQIAIGRLLGTEAQRCLAEPITPETSPLITALARIAHESSVFRVAFSPDGRLLTTASGDKTARIWSTALDDMLHQLCTGGGRNLSLSKWHRYLARRPTLATNVRELADAEGLILPPASIFHNAAYARYPRLP